MTIRTKALLYRPALSIWTARITDKSESIKLNKSAGAVDGAANVRKQLLPDMPQLEAIRKWATEFRTWVYLTTLPWDDSGWRIGRAERHMDFLHEAGQRIAQGNALVDAFIGEYEVARAQAQFKLNAMFDAADYPAVEEVKRKFNFVIDVQPMPDTEDFKAIAGVDQSEVDRLVAEASASSEARVAEAMKEAHMRLFKVVQTMHSTLTKFESKEMRRFNDTLVGNIATLVEVMPALNLTSDKRLDELTKQAKQLASYDAGDLRSDEGARKAAIADSKKLADKFKDFLEEELSE